MRRLARAERHRVAIQIIVEFGWADNTRVDDHARGTVRVPVRVARRGWEKDDLVTLANNDERDCRVEPQFCARVWWSRRSLVELGSGETRFTSDEK